MHYKTIVLGLLQDRPQLRDRLQQQRRMLLIVEQYALELKASHEEWQERLAQLRPGSDPVQIKSEAMELAIEELVKRLPSESNASDNETLPLDPQPARPKARSSDG